MSVNCLERTQFPFYIIVSILDLGVLKNWSLLFLVFSSFAGQLVKKQLGEID